jgi:DNA-directed RNA polymerase specialized sigma24 family protein
MDFVKDTDADLLCYMTMQADDPATARAAWGEFFIRNRVYLFNIVRRQYGRRLGGDEGAEDLVAEVFHKVFRWAGRHGGKVGALDRFWVDGGAESEKFALVQRRVRLWLGRMAVNRFKDALRAEDPATELELIVDGDGIRPFTSTALTAPETLAKLEAAIATLNPKDEEVLRVSLNWYDPEAGAFFFRPGEAEALARSLGLEVDALRQRRHRALKRLKEAISTESSTPASAEGRS